MTDETLKFLGSMVGSFIAAGSALTVMAFNLRAQARLEAERWRKAQDDERARWDRARADERDKWSRSQEDARKNAIRNAVADIGKHLAVGTHSICWLTWDANDHPEHVTIERIKAYDEETHRHFSDLVTSEATLAALDITRYLRLRPTVEEFESLDLQIGIASRLLGESPDEARQKFVECHKQGAAFRRELPERLAEVLSDLFGPDLTKPT